MLPLKRPLKESIYLCIVLLCLFFAAGQVMAQSGKGGKSKKKPPVSKQEAFAYYQERNFKKASYLFKKLSKENPEKLKYKYFLGRCYLEIPGKVPLAFGVLKQVLTSLTHQDQKEVDKKEVAYYLARACHLTYRFDQAIDYYKQAAGLTKQQLNDPVGIERQIDMCHNGIALIKDSLPVYIEPIGTTINTKRSEYNPVVDPKEQLIIFTSRRSGSKGGRMDVYGRPDPKGEYFEDLYISYWQDNQWAKPANIGSSINSPGHERSLDISRDGKRLLYYGYTPMKEGRLYQSERQQKKWGNGSLLTFDQPFETWGGSGSLSPDGKFFYFSASLSEGYGGKDLYYRKKQSDGSWGPPQNLGETINTPYDEISPKLSPDGKRLTFSSQGHKSMGGFDIFSCRLENGGWGKPKNLGFPINSVNDETGYLRTGNRGYFSSTNKTTGGNDLFVVHFKEAWKQYPVLVMLGDSAKTTDGETLLLENFPEPDRYVIYQATALDKVIDRLKQEPAAQATFYPFRPKDTGAVSDAALTAKRDQLFKVMIEKTGSSKQIGSHNTVVREQMSSGK